MKPRSHRRSLLALAALAPLAGLATAPRAAPGFDLVTAAEMARDLAATPAPASRALPNPAAPRIELLAPTLGKPMASPIDIRLRWEGVEGATVDPASVRVRYGRLGIDVTERVLGAAKVSAQGIEAPGARLPAGEHRLAIEVADSQRRVARREFVVEVLN